MSGKMKKKEPKEATCDASLLKNLGLETSNNSQSVYRRDIMGRRWDGLTP